MVAGVLDEASGVPRSPSRLLAFGSWLEPREAEGLEHAVERLRRHGEPFRLVLPTASDGLVEVRGRVAASAPVMSIRDLTGRAGAPTPFSPASMKRRRANWRRCARSSMALPVRPGFETATAP